MSKKIVGRKVKIVGAPTPEKWPLSGVLIGKCGVIVPLTYDFGDGPSIRVEIESPAHVGSVDFFPEELRYLNNRPVVLP